MFKWKIGGTFYGCTVTGTTWLNPPLNIKNGATSKDTELGHSKKGLSVAAASTKSHSAGLGTVYGADQREEETAFGKIQDGS